MADVSFNHAASAYKDATRVANKIISEVSDGKATSAAAENPIKPAFNQLVTDSLQSARDVGYKGENISTKAVANEANLHDLISAVSNADLTLSTVVSIRDRVINAYQDIVKMPI